MIPICEREHLTKQNSSAGHEEEPLHGLETHAASPLRIAHDLSYYITCMLRGANGMFEQIHANQRSIHNWRIGPYQALVLASVMASSWLALEPYEHHVIVRPLAGNLFDDIELLSAAMPGITIAKQLAGQSASA
jgi:hypothetical protein